MGRPPQAAMLQGQAPWHSGTQSSSCLLGLGETATQLPGQEPALYLLALGIVWLDITDHGWASSSCRLCAFRLQQRRQSRLLCDTEPVECVCRAAAAQQWDRGDWAEPGPITPGSRRPSDSSLPLHEAWMQHEAEWAQLNRVRVCPLSHKSVSSAPVTFKQISTTCTAPRQGCCEAR